LNELLGRTACTLERKVTEYGPKEQRWCQQKWLDQEQKRVCRKCVKRCLSKAEAA
jgi:hypothetical protein